MTVTDPIGIAIKVAEVLETLGISYVTGGSLAKSVWHEGLTASAIALIADFRLEKVPTFVQGIRPEFEASEIKIRNAIAAQSSFTIRHLATGALVKIALLKDDDIFTQSVFIRRTPQLVRFKPQRSLWLPSLEDIVLKELVAYRNGDRNAAEDWRDVVSIVKAQNQDLDFDYLREWTINLKVRNLLDRALVEAGFDPL